MENMDVMELTNFNTPLCNSTTTTDTDCKTLKKDLLTLSLSDGEAEKANGVDDGTQRLNHILPSSKSIGSSLLSQRTSRKLRVSLQKNVKSLTPGSDLFQTGVEMETPFTCVLSKSAPNFGVTNYTRTEILAQLAAYRQEKMQTPQRDEHPVELSTPVSVPRRKCTPKSLFHSADPQVGPVYVYSNTNIQKECALSDVSNKLLGEAPLMAVKGPRSRQVDIENMSSEMFSTNGACDQEN